MTQDEQTDNDDLLGDFCDEAMDLLQDLPDQLAQYERDPENTEAINTVFRAVHTVKGNAGFFGIPAVKDFAHALEDALDEVRQTQLVLNPQLTRSFVQGLDGLGELILGVQQGGCDVSISVTHQELLQQINTLCQVAQPSSTESRLLEEVLQLADEMATSDEAAARNWSKRLRSIAADSHHATPAQPHAMTSRGTEAQAPETSSSSFANGRDTDKRDTEPAQVDRASKCRFLRVREESVEDFMEDVSRLFITGERLKDLQLRMTRQWRTNKLVDELSQINATLSGQTTALQKSVVELRKVPVRGLFAKFPRVARSLASRLGKQLDVHLDGEDVEIDKSLVEDLDGPIMHMVRNVCDHGIQTPAEREARGLPTAGNLWLQCAQSKSHVVITIRDDGRGIDPDRLRQKAVEKGLYRAEEAASIPHEEAINLIFHPGLSTAATVSDVSGRGVGLDVVRDRLRELDGDVHVHSIVGEGTTFRLEIPLRRAVVVVDGLLVRSGKTLFVVPFEHTREILKLAPSEMHSVQGRSMAQVRGEPYPAVSLAEILQMEVNSPNTSGLSDGILIKSDQRWLLLLVESVVGHRKVVVSELASILPNCDQISGVAQLGGGDLALVLHTPELIRTAWRTGLCAASNDPLNGQATVVPRLRSRDGKHD